MIFKKTINKREKEIKRNKIRKERKKRQKKEGKLSSSCPWSAAITSTYSGCWSIQLAA
jgi:hypothetical protein